jgi:hypothetical protein
MSQLGQLDVQFGSLMPGPGTQDLARDVTQKYKGKVGEFMQKHTDLTSPQTIRDLSALRASYMQDPDVKSVLQDYTKGLPQYMQISGSRKTPRDIDPNIDPRTGRVRQLESGQQWAPYQQLQHYVDWRDPLMKELGRVDYRYQDVNTLGITSIKDPKTGVELPVISGERGKTGIRGEAEFRPSVETLASDIIEGRTDYADWYKRDFFAEHGREPTYDEVVKDIGEMAVPLYGEDPRVTPFFQQISGTRKSTDKPPITVPPPEGEPLPAHSISQATTEFKKGMEGAFRVDKQGEVRTKAVLSRKDPIFNWIFTPGFKTYKAMEAAIGKDNMDSLTETPGIGGAFVKAMKGLENIRIGRQVRPETMDIIDQVRVTRPEVYENLPDFNPQEIKGMPKEERNRVLETTEKYLTDVSTRAVHPRVEDFSGDPEENKKYLSYLNDNMGFTAKGVLSQGDQAIASLEAVMKTNDVEKLMRYGSPREHKVSIEQIFDKDKTNALQIIGRLSPDNHYHPNALILQGVDKDGRKITGRYIMPWKSGRDEAFGSDEVNYQNYFIPENLTATPFVDHVYPIDYSDWEELEVHAEKHEPKDKIKHLENKARPVPYVHFSWDKDIKQYKANVVSFQYNRKSGQYDKH